MDTIKVKKILVIVLHRLYINLYKTLFVLLHDLNTGLIVKYEICSLLGMLQLNNSISKSRFEMHDSISQFYCSIKIHGGCIELDCENLPRMQKCKPFTTLHPQTIFDSSSLQPATNLKVI